MFRILPWNWYWFGWKQCKDFRGFYLDLLDGLFTHFSLLIFKITKQTRDSLPSIILECWVWDLPGPFFCIPLSKQMFFFILGHVLCAIPIEIKLTNQERLTSIKRVETRYPLLGSCKDWELLVQLCHRNG